MISSCDPTSSLTPAELMGEQRSCRLAALLGEHEEITEFERRAVPIRA
jgi:hypothetical protein